MNNELNNQIEGMVGHFCSEFLDAYQCQEWGINAYDFCGLLLKESFKAMFQMAREIDEQNSTEE